MDHDNYPEHYIRDILNAVKTIALVGASINTARPSYFVTKYMIDKGYEVFPVNPGQAGKQIGGRTIYAALKDIPVAIDMVDIFRSVAAVPAVMDEALKLDPLPKVIWMQLSVRDDVQAKRAEELGIKVVMNRCPKIEYGRLSGEIGWTGFNTGVISAKRPKLAGRGAQHLVIARPNKSGGD